MDGIDSWVVWRWCVGHELIKLQGKFHVRSITARKRFTYNQSIQRRITCPGKWMVLTAFFPYLEECDEQKETVGITSKLFEKETGQEREQVVFGRGDSVAAETLTGGQESNGPVLDAAPAAQNSIGARLSSCTWGPIFIIFCNSRHKDSIIHFTTIQVNVVQFLMNSLRKQESTGTKLKRRTHWHRLYLFAPLSD